MFMVAIIMTTISSIGCGTAHPDAGHEAVLVMKPIIFGHEKKEEEGG
jgi:hypothetical protein